MALELSISTYTGNNCGSLYLNELTGAYNVDTNTTGYGTPNLELSAITSYSLQITLPDDAETVITIDSPAGLPSSNPDVTYEIPVATLDSTWTKIQDGLYTIVYTVSDGTTTYTTTYYHLSYCNIECCVAKMFAAIATATDCSCDSTIIKNALYADALLQSLIGNKDCGDVTAINNLLDKLNSICDFTDSDCGCN